MKASILKDNIILKSFAKGYKVKKGKVYSPKNKPLGTINSRGYIMIGLIYNKKLYLCSAHRIIWIWYNGIPSNKELEINHIDGNKLNNKRSNLELISNRKNVKHAYNANIINIPKGENRKNALLTDKQVKTIYYLYNVKLVTLTQLAKEYKVSKAVIYGICSGKSYKSVTEKLDIKRRASFSRALSKDIITIIKNLRKKGFTLQAICDTLSISSNTVIKYW